MYGEVYYIPPDSNNFPNPDRVNGIGPAVLGSNLNPSTIIKAYKMGYFPWDMEQGLIRWFHPNPRDVLFPDQVKIHKSMRPYLNQHKFDFKTNTAFEQVIDACRYIPRNYGLGSWINDDVRSAYLELHHMGVAHCAESWKNGRLVGGLYGLKLGKIFFGESMFARESNASKYALIKYSGQLHQEGVRLIDCQYMSHHLSFMGATSLTREVFIELLFQWIPEMDI